jgi:hypothetical protein
VRSVFVIGPDKKIKLMLTYPMTTGPQLRRDPARARLDAAHARHKVATPVNWKQGDDVIIAGSVNDDDAKKLFPHGWKAPKPYLRIVKHRRAGTMCLRTDRDRGGCQSTWSAATRPAPRR